jgi:hypothetical protein
MSHWNTGAKIIGPIPIAAQVAVEPAREDDGEEHGEGRVPHRADEEPVEDVELPELRDGPDKIRAHGDEERRPDHQRTRPVAVAQPAHDHDGGQSHDEGDGIGGRDVAARPAEELDQRLDEDAEGAVIGAARDSEHARREENDPGVMHLELSEGDHNLDFPALAATDKEQL